MGHTHFWTPAWPEQDSPGQKLNFFDTLLMFQLFCTKPICPGICPWHGLLVILVQPSANLKKIRIFPSHQQHHIWHWWHIKKKKYATYDRWATLPPWLQQHDLGRLPTFASSICPNSLDRLESQLNQCLSCWKTAALQVYPAFGPGKDFSMDWMLLIVARNLIAAWVICGFWDWFLYFSPLQVKHQLGQFTNVACDPK